MTMDQDSVECPVCGKSVTLGKINAHIDAACRDTPAAHHSLFKRRSSQEHSTRPDNKKAKPSSSSSDPQIESDNASESPVRVSKSIKLVAREPLAELARPTSLDNFVGQDDLVGPRGILRSLVKSDRVPSMILWGPSGTGKTTLARIIANETKSRFVELSATMHGVNDCKKVFEEAGKHWTMFKRRTILFIDEVHRFSKAQQDVCLPHVEKGTVTLIGATTENPSFKVNSALISRCRVFVLKSLSDENIVSVIRTAIQNFYSEKDAMKLDNECVQYLANIADGDARAALTALEVVMSLAEDLGEGEMLQKKDIESSMKRTSLVYDRKGDNMYDTISALHKSVRGSNPDAALYYLGRMLEAGEDPLYIARRMVRMASEDIGLADDSCLPFAMAAYQATQNIGMPESDTILAHCAVKLALAKKSVRVYRGYNAVKAVLKDENVRVAPIPIHLRNAPTRLMKQLGYGKEYKYNPDYVEGKCVQDYLPDSLNGTKFLPDIDLGEEHDPDLELEIL
ncbi:hypothetical protein CANCADRAFT_1715 [Tortispora caseinolytica NRRL Y-17796]|uniref:UBZ4-type domain-containing protein n=1 Tax=Tortispora caseinolytica NRRL Y-17796 TaxID=767744 RepID=A0A1E4TDZ4_9ASCO|nr:hypothetical protein CANCADRAFT_1715 [Tortispora caseinolytica NRRL Y-17796]